MPNYCFDRFELDGDQHLLLCEGVAVDVQPLVFDLIAYLARRPRKVVGKAELLPAVWRSSFVTDSVLARAIMKARRALRDDAQSPRLLRTVPRVGYILEADVQVRVRPTAAMAPVTPQAARSARLALLPLEDLTGQPALAWTAQGVMQLLHQWLEAGGGVHLVPLTQVEEFARRPCAAGDAMAQACRSLGADEVIRCQLAWHDGSFTLLCWQGATMPGRQVFERTGADVLELARRLADVLSGPMRSELTSGADAFWQEQVATVVRMQEAGQAEQALSLLERCLSQVAHCLPLALHKARLLCQCNRHADALTQVDLLLAHDSAVQPAALRVELWSLRGQCLHQLDRLGESMASFQQALDVSAHTPEALPLRPDILGHAARTACRQLDPAAAIRLAEQAVAEAEKLGHLEAHTRAALGLCGVLSILDQRHRSATAVAQAIDLGERSGVLEYQARAWRHRAALQSALQMHTEAHASIERSVALWLRCGHSPDLIWVQVLEVIICLEGGRFEQAERVACQLGARADLPATQRDVLELLGASLDWRQGRDPSAFARMRALVQRQPQPLNVTGLVTLSELTLMHIHVGELDEAQAALASIAHLPALNKLARRQAALALARGERRAAVAQLLDLWREGKTEGEEGYWIVLDLAWLLLEDAPVRFESPELESLFAHLLDLSQEPTAAQVLRAAYLLRQRPDAHSRADWDEVVGRAAVLQRRCPMMLTRSYREALASRTPPRLAELLSRVCW